MEARKRAAIRAAEALAERESSRLQAQRTETQTELEDRNAALQDA